MVSHLNERVAQLNAKAKEQDNTRETEVARIEDERNALKDQREEAGMEITKILDFINQDTEERKRREEEQNAEKEAEEAKIKEKMSMDDAARYIQRRWQWF